MNTVEQLTNTSNGTLRIVLDIPVELYKLLKQHTPPRQVNPLLRRLIADHILNELNKPTITTQEN